MNLLVYTIIIIKRIIGTNKLDYKIYIKILFNLFPRYLINRFRRYIINYIK